MQNNPFIKICLFGSVLNSKKSFEGKAFLVAKNIKDNSILNPIYKKITIKNADGIEITVNLLIHNLLVSGTFLNGVVLVYDGTNLEEIQEHRERFSLQNPNIKFIMVGFNLGSEVLNEEARKWATSNNIQYLDINSNKDSADTVFKALATACIDSPPLTCIDSTSLKRKTNNNPLWLDIFVIISLIGLSLVTGLFLTPLSVFLGVTYFTYANKQTKFIADSETTQATDRNKPELEPSATTTSTTTNILSPQSSPTLVSPPASGTLAVAPQSGSGTSPQTATEQVRQAFALFSYAGEATDITVGIITDNKTKNQNVVLIFTFKNKEYANNFLNFIKPYLKTKSQPSVRKIEQKFTVQLNKENLKTLFKVLENPIPSNQVEDVVNNFEKEALASTNSCGVKLI